MSNKEVPSDDHYETLSEWQIARLYLKQLGEPSNLFTGCCRSLIHSSGSENGRLTRLASAKLQRLLSSPTMLSQIYFAAKTYYKNDISIRGTIEPADLTFFISPIEFASLITIGYNTRRIAKSLNHDDWNLILDPFQRYMDLAVPLGNAIPTVGPSLSLMAASGKFLGWGILNLRDPISFKKYRVENKVKKRSYDLAAELEIFGTTHLHISSLIWQTFGFGVKNSEDYLTGLSKLSTRTLSEAAIKFRVARSWLESLIELGAPPSQSLGDDFEIESNDSSNFIDTYKSIKEKGSEFKWLSRNRDDIGVEKTPDLLINYEEIGKLLKRRGRSKDLD